MWISPSPREPAYISVRGVLQLMRVVPLSIWSVPTILFGFCAVPYRDPGATTALVEAVAGAMVLQGLITHGLNDIYDWQSGTDQVSLGVISGGSKVLRQGCMNLRGLFWVVAGAAVLYLGLALALAYLRGGWVLLWAAVGLWGAVAYSLPPLRLSYRPGLGEWGALFPTMAAGVLLGGAAAAPGVHGETMLAALWFAVFCVASVMQHHFADMDADWQAVPRKRTTPAFWKHQQHRSPKEIVLVYEGVSFVVALGGTRMAPGIFFPGAMASLAAAVVTASTPLNGGIRVLTRRDLAIKLLVPLTITAVLAIRLIG